MSDDPSREKVFARKSWKVWFLVTGGMVIMGAINLAIGFSLWPDEELEDPMSNRPPPTITDPGFADAGVAPVEPDAGTAAGGGAGTGAGAGAGAGAGDEGGAE